MNTDEVFRFDEAMRILLMEEDKERLDWMERQNFLHLSNGTYDVPGESWTIVTPMAEATGETLRAAIDVAMRRERPSA